ncbi:hypothetical protein J5277_22810 [Rhizobium sp. 16-449-1b]|uniref:hypothetical protein n=1 Tax=Rhizobium sp. 16-449-1b TaxID=2819989 RepID=UPI001ADBA241|nr:hypothetical protein [Rhizobium sp. 16-449-1b]MBO9196948.1 hypothetical protein [Rhizobium sp. 16-449-1b]
MEELSAIISRFPAQELSIRRLYARAPEFRSLCEDYATARCALERWKADERKADDFRRLSEEIELEIQELLEHSMDWNRH